MAQYTLYATPGPERGSVLPRLRPRAGGAQDFRDDAGMERVVPFLSGALAEHNLSLLVRIWGRRDSGMLRMRDGTEETTMIPLCRGGVVDALDVMELAERVGRVDLSFEPYDVAGSGDWQALGELLYRLAEDLVPPGLERATCPVAFNAMPGFDQLVALPIPASVCETLLTVSAKSRAGVVRIDHPTPALRRAVLVLQRLGMLITVHQAPPHAAGPEVPPRAPPCIDLFGADDAYEEQSGDEGTHPSLEITGEQDRDQLEQLIAARQAIAARDWATAEAHLVAARDARMDNPLVLAWLAWVRLEAAGSEHAAEYADQSVAWVELASAMAPDDPDILRIAGTVRRLAARAR